jgi:hypothetical protein
MGTGSMNPDCGGHWTEKVKGTSGFRLEKTEANQQVIHNIGLNGRDRSILPI